MRTAIAAAVAAAALGVSQAGHAGMDEARKWIDEEFQPSTLSKAEQMQRFGAFAAHYVVIPSLFLQPDIAQRHGLRRGPGLSLVNVSVLDSAGNAG